MDEVTAARTALTAWDSVVGSASPVPMRVVHNPLWRVDTPAGRGYVLRRLPEFPPGVGPVEEFRVLSYLQARGIPVAAPIVTDDGAIFTRVGEARYALLPLVRNDPGNHELGSDAAAAAYAIGAAIGRLDQALADCPWQVQSFVDDPARELVEVWLPGLPEEVTRLVAPLTEHLRQATADLPMQRTVGDCNTGNVLVHDGQVSGFIDLDHLPIGPRVRDLSDYLASRLRRHLALPDRAERERAVDALVAFLGRYVAGYHEAYALSERERAAVAPLILMVEIGLASWCRHGWTPDPDGYQQSVHTIGWILDRYEVLVAAAC